MLKSRSVLVLFVLVCLSTAIVKSQKTPQSVEGAPLKDVDVKLGRIAGGTGRVTPTFIFDNKSGSRTTTDAQGHFNFPIMPEGDYVLVFTLPKETGASVKSETPIGFVFLNLPNGIKEQKGYNFVEDKTFDLPDATDRRRRQQQPEVFGLNPENLRPFIVHSDGVHPVNGAIVKSKSNISNN